MKISDEVLTEILKLFTDADKVYIESNSCFWQISKQVSPERLALALIELQQLREERRLRDIKSAPRDRTSILLKVKDAPFLPDRCEDLAGIWLVGRSDSMGDWGFAAPVGYGGIPDKWIEGWLPLPIGLPEEDK